jgi:deoxyribonuclease V
VKACVDVHYLGDQARVALVQFQDWSDADPFAVTVFSTTVTASYLPGEFYRRELNPILLALNQASVPWEVVIVDGYCDLSPDGQKGLGAYLFEATDLVPAVIGVAKSAFRGATHAIEVQRGTSARPLFVTACGMDASLAAERIRDMHGPYRMPTLLKLADSLSRRADSAGGFESVATVEE